MKPILISFLTPLFGFALMYGADNSNAYHLGTYITATSVADGTIIDNFNCGARILGSRVCSGGVQANITVLQNNNLM